METSFQLYSARNEPSWRGVLQMLSEQGYSQVEGFGGNYEDAAGFRAMLDEFGLSMPSGHFFPVGCFEDDLESSIAAAKTLGMNRVFVPAPEDEYREGASAEKWIELAARLETACQKVSAEGLRFGWHNHHWEFMPLADGTLPMDLILKHAPSIDWEIDVAWVIRGGHDPIASINKHAHRITSAHIKDIAPDGECLDEDGWQDVGHGTVYWAPIMEALRTAQVDIFVMEHDNPSDARRFAERSITAFKDM